MSSGDYSIVVVAVVVLAVVVIVVDAGVDAAAGVDIFDIFAAVFLVEYKTEGPIC